MPLLSDYEEFDLTALEIDSVDFEGTKLSVDFGNDYGAFALPAGNNAGPKRWVISSGCLPDDADYLNLVNDMPRFEYWVDFWQRHTTGDEEIFMIEFRGEHFHCKFAETTMSASMETIDLFTAEGVEVVKRKVAGIAYNANGSIRFPWAWITAADAINGDLGAAVDDDPVKYIPDASGNGNDFGAAVGSLRPTLQTNEVNGLPVIRFDGTNDFLSWAGSEVTLYDLFMVIKIDGATFPDDGGILRDGTEFGDDFLMGDSTETKFADLTLTNYEYRKNGTLFADNNQQAPMAAFKVIHLRSTDGFDFPTAVILGYSQADVYGAFDLAEFWFYDAALTTLQYETLTTALMTKYGLS